MLFLIYVKQLVLLSACYITACWSLSYTVNAVKSYAPLSSWAVVFGVVSGLLSSLSLAVLVLLYFMRMPDTSRMWCVSWLSMIVVPTILSLSWVFALLTTLFSGTLLLAAYVFFGVVTLALIAYSHYGLSYSLYEKVG